MGNQSENVFEVNAEQMFGRVVYRARCRLQLPAPHHLYVAEGVGEDERDAVLLAAMHAERVCDALGVPLFRLPLMQKKHAESVRRQGRYAPMPGDPIKPENTPTPPPLRMVVLPNSGANVEGKSAFLPSIAEAEIVKESNARRGSGKRGHERLEKVEILKRSETKAGTGAPAAVEMSAEFELDGTGDGNDDSDGCAVDGSEQAYHTTVHYPWLVSGQRGCGVEGAVVLPPVCGSASGGGSSLPSVSGSTCFDPTEGGLWQMVNTNSTRCSPSPFALVLPCVFETAAHERIKDYFLQQGISLKSRVNFSHVVVPGHSARMYVAEIRLFDATVARGKAQTRDCAEQLAAMHAELLLDALAQPIFPQDPERQAKHAVAVAKFGRWAPNTLTGELRHPRPHDALPLPLKQHVGGDDVWLDPLVSQRSGYQRSVGERMIAAHNEVNNYCGDYIEANPDPALLSEAREALESWQRDVARNPHPDLFLITRMGDQFRASTLLPVPRSFGIRGGNAVGKTMEQSMDLCALHAVDTLCALGIPIYLDKKKQKDFIERRRKMGLVTEDAMLGIRDSNGLVAIPAPSLQGLGSVAPKSPGSAVVVPDTTGRSCGEESEGKGRRSRPPYLPGYMVEGNQERPLPHISDTLHILKLRIPEDFTVYGETLSDEAIIEAGNDAKICVQNYLRQQLPRNANVNPSVYITGYCRQVSVHNIAYLPLALPRQKEKRDSQKCMGSGGKDSTVVRPALATDNTEDVASDGAEGTAHTASRAATQEERYSAVGQAVTTTERILAVGISLKKKDAERMCFLHAVDLLRGFGVDVLSSCRAGLPRRRSCRSFAHATTSNEGAKADGKPGQRLTNGGTAPVTESALAKQETTEQSSEEQYASAPPKPYMHKFMMNFMASGRHYTPPKRRFAPSPYSPF
ncbi:hypothetical protein TRVL_01593 [Trypanosoma vivax]|nr:hypothetical protein TRVL_01593 [Trypanosoma vivax]